MKINLISTDKFPCLSVNQKLISSDTSEIVDVVNDIPVIVIPKPHWSIYEMPSITNYQVCSNLPKFKTLRKYVDTHKSVSKRLNLEFKNDCSFQISAKADSVTVSSSFNNIKCTNYDENETTSQTVMAHVDSKKFSNILHFIQCIPQKLLKSAVREGGPLKIYWKFGEHIEIICLISLLCVEEDD